MDIYQRLSGESHQRIFDARNKAALIWLEAAAIVDTQYNSEYGLLPSELARLFAASSNFRDLEAVAAAIFTKEREKRYVSFEDYCVKNSSVALLATEARLNAARIVGKAIVSELSTVASGLEMWGYLQEPQSLLRSLEREFKLTELQGQILWTELKIDPGFEGVTKSASRIRNAPPENVLAVPNTASWTEVSIRFMNDSTVQTKMRGPVKNCEYSDMGFADGRRTGPIKAWAALRQLAEADSPIHLDKTIACAIRRKLKSHFSIVDGDPLPLSLIHISEPTR